MLADDNLSFASLSPSSAVWDDPVDVAARASLQILVKGMSRARVTDLPLSHTPSHSHSNSLSLSLSSLSLSLSLSLSKLLQTNSLVSNCIVCIYEWEQQRRPTEAAVTFLSRDGHKLRARHASSEPCSFDGLVRMVGNQRSPRPFAVNCQADPLNRMSLLRRESKRQVTSRSSRRIVFTGLCSRPARCSADA